MNWAIKVTGISKKYELGRESSAPRLLVEQLASAIRNPVRSLKKAMTRERPQYFNALSEVSFSADRGDILGIVGRNGAGKSTLLKILSRITEPSSGRAVVRGRLASLLEVGTGFHPELTGRENIYLNATILGMRRRETDSRFDEIVAFAGVERFLDTPVKHYSSGMYVRLAFAVAAHVEADTLLVDEVLAVGDAEFQRRCLGKMSQVANEGRTVVFVSHNLTALRNICTSGLLLDRGVVAAQGTVTEVLKAYGSSGVEKGGRSVTLSSDLRNSSSASLRRISIESSHGSDVELRLDRPLQIVIDVDVHETSEIAPFIHCYNEQREMVFSSGSFFVAHLNGTKLDAGRHQFACEIPGNFFNDGEYTLDVLLLRNRRDVVASELSVMQFRIEDSPVADGWHWRPAGVVRPALLWTHHLAANER